MEKYCEDCGCVMEVVGCSNCNELECINYFQALEREEIIKIKEN